jgi:hypothetical protein
MWLVDRSMKYISLGTTNTGEIKMAEDLAPFTDSINSALYNANPPSVSDTT